MLHDDSLEFDTVVNLTSASLIPNIKCVELVPMMKWQDIKFSKIWISEEFVPNRRLPPKTSFNTIKPAIFHTLEKSQPVTDSLSVYSENDITVSSNFNSSEKLSDSLEEFIPKYLNSTENFNIKSEDKTDTDDSVYERPDSPTNSLAGYLEHFTFSDDDDLEYSAIKDTPTKSEIPLNSLILSKTTSSWRLDQLVGLNEKNEHLQLESTNSSKIETVPDVKAKYSPDASFSDADFCDNSELTENKNLNESEITTADWRRDQAVDLIELSEQIWTSQLESQEVIEKETDSSFLAKVTQNSILPISDSGEDSEQTQDKNLADVEESTASVCDIEDPVQIITFPTQSKKKDFAYTVPKDKKLKKEKKGKNKTSRQIPVKDFFLSKTEATGSETEFKAFCDGLNQKFGYADALKKESFPSSQSQQFSHQTQEIELSEGFWSPHVASSVEEPSYSLNEYMNPKVLRTSSSVTKYVFENIPLSVDEESFQSLLSPFGDIVDCSLKRRGVTFKAEVSMRNVENPTWLIDCLNGTHSFGASSGEALKCYLTY